MLEQALASARQGEGSRERESPRLHVLILTDRDWTHPQGGGTGTHLYGHVSRWLAQGHRVTVVACGYPGAVPFEQIDGLTIHRMGGRVTLFPRAIWRLSRGLVPDADVTLEVINGISYLTPLWWRAPRVAMVHHIHRGMYRDELGFLGRLAAFVLETAPLRFLYRGSRFVTVSEVSAVDICAHGIPREHVEVNYNGVELAAFAPGERAKEPTMLFLGRLKRYKQIEELLTVVEELPGVRLEIAGDGDHREQLEAEIALRGIEDRVRLHGFVDEQTKLELLQRAWVHATASPREGWCLTVMEAAACGTPTVGVAAGGLNESVLHGQTGLLADSADGLTEVTRMLIEDEDLREVLGRQAKERAHSFTWDKAAANTLDSLRRERARTEARPIPGRSTILTTPQSSPSGGMGAAVVASTVVTLLFTLLLARIVGSGSFGELAAIVSVFMMFALPGAALQISVASAVDEALTRGRAALGATVSMWMNSMAIVTVAVAAAALILRDQLASVIGGPSLAAAATLPVGCLWLMLCVQRGALQGLRETRLVGRSLVFEASARIGLGALLGAIGFGVTGVFLGAAAGMVVTWLLLEHDLRRRLGPPVHDPDPSVQRPSLRAVLVGARAPLLALALVGIVQNVDVIIANHAAGARTASSYAAASLVAKAFVWTAVAVGLYLLPEAARLRRNGTDSRPMLVGAVWIVALAAVPLLLLSWLIAKPLISFFLGSSFSDAAGSLPLLWVAAAAAVCVYLAVQYLIAFARWRFLFVLAVAAVVEPLVLARFHGQPTHLALGLGISQLLLAVTLIAISLRGGSAMLGLAPGTRAVE